MSAPKEITKEEFERRIRYMGETDARMTEVRNRARGAKHFIRRREIEYAKEELLHVINEARKLRLHLEAWENYMGETKQ